MSLARRSIAEMVGTFSRSPGGYALPSAVMCELVLTCGFLLVIMGVTDKERAPAGFAPLAIGLALTLIHPISIPVTNTSVNPARSTGVALFAGSCCSTERSLSRGGFHFANNAPSLKTKQREVESC